MRETDMILQLAKDNNGTVTSAMVTNAGLSRANLKHLVDSGGLERTGRGVYVLPNIFEDEMFTTAMPI